MKLEYDLIKEILAHVEEVSDGATRNSILKSDFQENDEQWGEFLRLAYHYGILIDNGFLDGEIQNVPYQGHRVPTNIDFFKLTLQGHKLLDGMRNDSVWEKLKSNAKLVGVEGLKQIPALAIEMIKGGAA